MPAVTIASASRAWLEASTTNYWSARIAFDTGTALYVVTQDTGATPKIRVQKSTSRSSPSFAEQDSANNKAVNSVNSPYSAWYDTARYIHIACFTAATTLTHYVFDTSTDTWTSLGHGNPTTAASVKRPLRIVSTTADDPIIIANSNADDADLLGVGWDGSTWLFSASFYVAGTSAEASTVADAVIGSTRVYLYTDVVLDDLFAATRSASNVKTQVAIDATVQAVDTGHSAGGVFVPFVESTVNKAVVAYIESDGTLRESVVSLDTNPITSTQIAATAAIEATATNVGARTPLSTARFGTTDYALWWDDASAGTIFYATKTAGVWGGRTAWKTGVSRPIQLLPVGTDGLLAVYQSDATTIAIDWIVAPASSSTSTRTVAQTAAIRTTNTRTVTQTAALSTTTSRTITQTASLSVTGGGTRTVPQTANISVVGGSSYPSAVLSTTGLIGYWRLGEASGTVALDSSGNARDGTISGAPAMGTTGLLTGDTNTAITLDGVNDTIEIPSTAFQFASGAPFTLEVWLTLSNLTQSASYPQLFNKRLAADGGNKRGFGVFLSPDFSNKFMFEYLGEAADVEKLFPTTMVADVRTHLVAVCDGTNLTLYQNNVATTATSITAATWTTTLGSLYIGSAAATGQWLAAVVDEIAIYNVGLSAATVDDHYTKGTTAGGTTSTRTVTQTAAVSTTVSRTVTQTAALSITSTRTVLQTTGVRTTLARTVTGTAAIITTNPRTVTQTAALRTTSSRTVPQTAAILTTQSRTVAQTAAVKVNDLTRMVPQSAALRTSSSRTITQSSALRTTTSRTVPQTAATTTTSTRTVSQTAALSVTSTGTRTILQTAAIQATSARTIGQSAAILTASTRTVEQTAALAMSVSLTVSQTAALAAISTRTIGQSAALQTTTVRTIAQTAAIRTTTTRTIPQTANLSVTGTSTRTVPQSVALRTVSTRTIGQTAAVRTTASRTVSGTAAIRTTNSRTVTQSAALRTSSSRTVAQTASLAVTGTNTRTVPQTSAIRTTTTRTVPQAAALRSESTRAVAQSVALSTTSIRTIPQDMTLAVTTARAVPQDAAVLATTTRTVPQLAALGVSWSRVIPQTAALVLGVPITHFITFAAPDQPRTFAALANPSTYAASDTGSGYDASDRPATYAATDPTITYDGSTR